MIAAWLPVPLAELVHRSSGAAGGAPDGPVALQELRPGEWDTGARVASVSVLGLVDLVQKRWCDYSGSAHVR